MLDILSIGDCTIDVFLNVEEGNVLCNLKKQMCQICFKYGDKIPVKQVIQISGTGNAANLAIGASRLGLTSAINTIVGNEGSHDNIVRHFKKEKVNLDYLTHDQKSPTNYSAIINYQGERTIFSHHAIRHYHFPKINKKPQWIYLTSVGKNYEKLYQQTIKYCQKNNVKLGFNPGSLQVRDGIKKIKPVIEQCEVVLLNKDEAREILQEQKIKDVKYYLKKYFQLGAKHVVITDGENGAYSFDGQNFLHIETLKSKVIERTGAGDAFSTAYISALIYQETYENALKWGTLNSDSVIKYIGPQAGLLTRKQILSKLKRQKFNIRNI